MLSTDPFYLSLSEEQKKYFSEAIEKMGWLEHQQIGIWGGGRSTIPDDKGNCLFYKDNYSTKDLYYQLQIHKEIPTDEEILNDIRNKRLKEIL